MQGLAAFAGAGVPPLLPGARIADQSDRLGADVLQFEFPGVELRRAKQIAAAAVFQGIPQRALRQERGSPPASRPLPCPAPPRAQPKPRFGLQRPHPGGRDGSITVASQSGTARASNSASREALRLERVAFGQVPSAASDLCSHRLLPIQPAPPPEVGEYRLAHRVPRSSRDNPRCAFNSARSTPSAGCSRIGSRDNPLRQLQQRLAGSRSRAPALQAQSCRVVFPQSPRAGEQLP